MEGIELRQYRKEDNEAIRSLHIRGLKSVNSYIENPEMRAVWDSDFDAMDKAYFDNRGDFLVMTNEGSLIGMGALRNVDAETVEIKRMRVEPEFQGKGLGGNILDALVQRAKELGYKKIILDTSVKQVAAQHLYESRGFKKYKQEDYYGQDTFYYELAI